MIVAGIGFSSACPAADIVRAVRVAEAASGRVAQSLAAPDWKRGAPALLEAAGRLGLPVAYAAPDALAAAQPRCVTRSAAALRAVGMASVAEAAALAFGGRLLLPRVAQGRATCALAGA